VKLVVDTSVKTLWNGRSKRWIYYALALCCERCGFLYFRII